MPSTRRLIRSQKGEVVKISSALGDPSKDRRKQWPDTAFFNPIAKNVDGDGLKPCAKRAIRMGLEQKNHICCSCTDDCATNPTCECLKMAETLKKAMGSDLIHHRKYIHNPVSDWKYEYYDQPRFVCGPRCSCHRACSLNAVQDIDKQLPDKFKVTRLDAKGFGLYSTQDVPAGAPIISFNGELVGQSEVDRDMNINQYSLQLIAKDDPIENLLKVCKTINREYKKELKLAYCTDIFVNPLEKGNVARFANHSCDANMEHLRVFQGGISPADLRVVFTATKDIKAGDELTFNYGPNYVTDHLGNKCLCEKCQAD